MVIGSFFWGSIFITSFTGVFAERYGSRRIGGFALITATILTALTPLSANFLWLTIVLRFFTGVVVVSNF